MKNKIEFKIGKGKPFSIQGGNGSLEIMAEEIDSPFTDYSGEPFKAADGQEFAHISTEGETTFLMINPEFEIGSRRTIRIHLPINNELDLMAESSNGSIKMSHLQGRIKATTRNGRIDLTNITGTIEATCANGSITGKTLDGTLNASSANGRVVIRESIISGGNIKSGNGRIQIQMNPAPNGSLSIFSGNGRVKLGLPEDSNFKIRVFTKGKLFNELESYSVQTEQGATIISKGEGGFSIFIQNYRGGVALMKYQDFDKVPNEDSFSAEFEKGFEDIGDFFSNIFGCFEPGQSSRDKSGFEEEINKFVHGMGRFGSKFGRMGEEMSRRFSETGRKSKNDEIRIVLEMLQEGRISAEEAERLINAIKGR